VHAILTVTSPEAGVDERLVLTCDATRTAEGLRMLARTSNRGLVRADITLLATTRRATFTFRLADEGDLRLADQILLHRMFAAFATGGQIDMYLIEYNITSRTEFGPQSEFADGAAALTGLELLAEVGRLLGIEPEPLDEFGDHDVALLGWARQLLAAGQAPMVVGGDGLTLRGTEALWDDVRSRADANGRMSIAWPEESYPIQVGGQTLDLGPVWHVVRGAQLPEAPILEDGDTVVAITWNTSANHVVQREPPGKEEPAKPDGKPQT